MNNSLRVFSYEGVEVRTVEINGEPWFVGKDVATVLGYSNTNDALIRHVADEDKLTSRITMSGQGRDVVIINESGLYSLIFSSQLPTAKQFKHWVTSEVLPQIRRSGTYSLNVDRLPITKQEVESMAFLYEYAGLKDNQAILALDKYIKSCTGKSALQVAGIELEAPTKKQLLTPTEIGEQFGLSARHVNNILAGAGYQHKIAGKWEPLEPGIPYAVMQDTGKKHSDCTPVRQLKWDGSILKDFEAISTGNFFQEAD